MARHWLVKSDPETFGVEQLGASPGQTTCWDGVRNYQARNLLRDEMRAGDLALFYHSQAEPPAVVGTARVVRAGYPDPSQSDRRSPYYDPDSPPEQPRWYAVDLRLEREFEQPVSLPQLRQTPGLEDMVLLRRGSRLSVQPVTSSEWKIVIALSRRRTPSAARGRGVKR